MPAGTALMAGTGLALSVLLAMRLGTAVMMSAGGTVAVITRMKRRGRG